MKATDRIYQRMVTMRYVLSTVLSIVLFSCTANCAVADEASPQNLVQVTVSEAIADIQAHENVYRDDKAKLRAMIEARVAPHFSFERMTQLALGQNWKNASPEQRQKITAEFRRLLIRSYSNSLYDYRTQIPNIKIATQSEKNRRAVVRVNVDANDGRSAVLHIRMERRSQGWQVIDVMVNGVSLIVNYRASFANEVAQGGYEQLISMLETENSKEQ